MELILDTAEFPVPSSIEECYRDIVTTCFARLGVVLDYEIDCSYVGDEEMRGLNSSYRGIDRPTDVLSFAFNEGSDPVSLLRLGEGERPLLGEIIIDYPQAIRQAEEIGNTPLRELSFLFLHGLLHLLGYDHMVEEEARTMFALQDEILQEVNGNGR